MNYFYVLGKLFVKNSIRSHLLGGIGKMSHAESWFELTQETHLRQTLPLFSLWICCFRIVSYCHWLVCTFVRIFAIQHTVESSVPTFCIKLPTNQLRPKDIKQRTHIQHRKVTIHYLMSYYNNPRDHKGPNNGNKNSGSGLSWGSSDNPQKNNHNVTNNGMNEYGGPQRLLRGNPRNNNDNGPNNGNGHNGPGLQWRDSSNPRNLQLGLAVESKATTKKWIQRQFAKGGIFQKHGNKVVSVIDSYSQKRIADAVVGRHCSHLQPFDASSFLNRSYDINQKCPVCNKQVQRKELVKMEYFQEAFDYLKAEQPRVERISIQRDGTWKMVMNDWQWWFTIHITTLP